MHYLRIALTTLLLLPSVAFSNSIEAPGTIFYQMPDGPIVKRSVSLEVPSRGQGDVILKSSDSEIVAKKFFSKDANGRTLFFVVFDEFPGQQEGEIAVFKGTYIRGSNLALYYGDVFVGPANNWQQWQLEEMLERDHHEEFRYVAGFKFASRIEGSGE